jgi:hypothetical protein
MRFLGARNHDRPASGNPPDTPDLEAGDRVEFRVEGTTVTLRKAERRLADDLVFRLVQTHTMRDWNMPEDDEAFRGL